MFVVQAKLGGQVIGEGSGRTKKAAEQAAAYNALTQNSGQTTSGGALTQNGGQVSACGTQEENGR